VLAYDIACTKFSEHKIEFDHESYRSCWERDRRARVSERERKQKEPACDLSYISNNGLPSTVFEKFKDTLPSLQVTEAIDSDVNKGPFVKVFHDRCNTTDDALSNACTNTTIVISTGHVCERSKCLQKGNNQ
jgi:hypothetical protein